MADRVASSAYTCSKCVPLQTLSDNGALSTHRKLTHYTCLGHPQSRTTCSWRGLLEKWKAHRPKGQLGCIGLVQEDDRPAEKPCLSIETLLQAVGLRPEIRDIFTGINIPSSEEATEDRLQGFHQQVCRRPTLIPQTQEKDELPNPEDLHVWLSRQILSPGSILSVSHPVSYICRAGII